MESGAAFRASASAFGKMSQPIPLHSFQTTRWSLVREAASGDDTAAQSALSGLCQAYWYPIYAYIRRRGHAQADAEDLTQGFFAGLLERHALSTADPARGKLRTFLLACVNNYLADEHDRAMTQKRGGGQAASFDGLWAEDRYGTEPIDELTPDRLFQRRWALTVLEHALELVGAEFAAQGREKLFDALRPFLGFGPEPAQCYEELAVAFGMPEGTLKSHVFRLRERWREILFEQVAMTLDEPDPETIRAELAELLTCL
jgi:RNA polymerase sigma-70 factor (ECF subfamily)